MNVDGVAIATIISQYLSTDISDNISDDKNMISNEVEIIDVEYI